jgi:uncharacterized SAM-binding protein YcdF (DUF218 family)
VTKVLLEAILLPPGCVIALLAAGVLVAALGRPRWAMALHVTALLALWAMSTPALSHRLAKVLEARFPPTPVNGLPKAEAILVLGGGLDPALSPRFEAELNDAADRLLHAARLYRAGRAPLVVASGGFAPFARASEPEAVAMARILTEWGVPSHAILTETGSRDTVGNCTRSRRLLADRHVGPVLLVTSAHHMPRALATCRSAGIDATPATTDVRVLDGTPSLPWLPSAVSLHVTAGALHEFAGIAVYAARGWLDLEDVWGREPAPPTPPPAPAPSP